MSSTSSPAESSPPSRLRSINSGTRIIARGGSRLEDRLAGNPPAGCLAAQPHVDGGGDVGELALVDTTGRILSGHVGEQQCVLARVVGRGRRRIAAVIRRQDQQVSWSHRLEEVGQTPVEVL